MQDNSSAFYKRVGALGAATALAVSGAFIASPAIASPTAEPEPTATEAPVATATEAPAESVVDETVTDEVTEEAVIDEADSTEEAGTLAPGLAEALLRDLGMTVEEFEAAGELGKKAADALPELQETEGFVGIAIDDDKIVITGSGEALEALALELDATLVAPAEEAEATEAPVPSEEATDAPSAEATEAAEEPASEEETAAPVSLPGNHRQAIETIRADYIANIGVVGLQSIMWDGSSYVISVKKAATVDDSVIAKSLAEVAGTPADTFAKKYANVTIADASGPAIPLEDVVNGQGYATFTGNSGGTCSIGFNAFNASGDAAVISAGHCADDGAATDTILTVPADDTAGGGSQPSLASPLGTWGFSQFGGENNSPTEINSGKNIGTDIGVINGINSELDLLPEVTQWTKPSDLTADTVKITGTTDAVPGAPMCKSGRTTGWSCGKVKGLGEFYVGAADGVRGVWGFESTLEKNAAPGDSGGSVISGSNAMGLVSAGPEGGNFFFSTSLSDGMKRLGGYSVAVFVAAPELTSHKNEGTVLTDEAISGTAPAGSTVKLTRDGETTDLDVVDGKWSFTAPSTVPADGKLEFTVQAVNGFNKSKTATYALTVKEAPLAVPVITSPAADAKIADTFGTVTGTGVAGAEVSVTVSGNSTAEEADAAGTLAAVRETGTATVTDKGTWSLKLDEALSYGAYTVTASQDGIAGKAESPTATSKFTVFLEKAVITSLADGQEFIEGETPKEISGTGTAGAEMAVTVGDVTLTTDVNDEGNWMVRGIPALAPGSFPVSAVQKLEGATAEAAYLVFMVKAAEIVEQAPPVVPPTPAPGDPTPAPTQPGNPTPKPTPAPDNNGDGLPDTGVAGMGLFAGAGALLTAGGLSALLINRRRQTQDA